VRLKAQSLFNFGGLERLMASATVFFSYDAGLLINSGDSGELGSFRGQNFCGGFKI
jgi:hypothetical protein